MLLKAVAVLDTVDAVEAVDAVAALLCPGGIAIGTRRAHIAPRLRDAPFMALCPGTARRGGRRSDTSCHGGLSMVKVWFYKLSEEQ